MFWDIARAGLSLAVIGFVLGFLIFLVSKYFYVEEDNRIEGIVELLPKYNCGACGYPGCKEMAIGLLAKESKPSGCKPMKKEDADILQKHLDELFAAKAES